MKFKGLLAGAFLFAPFMLFAHEYRMFPVNMEFRIDSDRVRVRITSQEKYWIDEILMVPFGKSLPAKNWPEPYLSRARDYVMDAFQISSDGRPLVHDKFLTRYTKEPLDSSSGRVEFLISYPVSPMGARLSGRAQFFKAYHDEIAKSGMRHEEDGVFLTRLHVVGKEDLRLELPFEKPEFDFEVAGHEFTQGQARKERMTEIMVNVFSSPIFWLLAIFLGYKGWERYKKRKEE